MRQIKKTYKKGVFKNCVTVLSLKKHFCFSFEFNDTWRNFITLQLQLHQFSLNSDEKQKN